MANLTFPRRRKISGKKKYISQFAREPYEKPDTLQMNNVFYEY